MATVQEVINAIIAEDTVLNSRITSTDLGSVGEQLLADGNDKLKNAFINTLINKVALTEIKSRIATNPLTRLKSSGIKYGRFIENVHLNSAKGRDYDRSGKDLLKVEGKTPDVVTEYYDIERQKVYDYVIYDADLKQAFTSETEFKKLYNNIIAGLTSGDSIEEYLSMKGTLGKAVKEKKMKIFNLTDNAGNNLEGSALGEGVLKTLHNLSDDFIIPSTQYNSFKINNPTTGTDRECFTPKENQIIIMRNDVKNTINLDVLARMYNKSLAEMEQTTLYVDNFTGANNCYCIIADDNWFTCKDTLFKTKIFENGDGLWTKVWLHHWQYMSLSNLTNAVAICGKATQ